MKNALLLLATTLVVAGMLIAGAGPALAESADPAPHQQCFWSNAADACVQSSNDNPNGIVGCSDPQGCGKITPTPPVCCVSIFPLAVMALWALGKRMGLY